MSGGFEPPPYPFERLGDVRALAEAHDGGCVDLSTGTPRDPAPDVAARALADAAALGPYPPSIGAPALRDAAAGWMERRFGVSVPTDAIAACIGTKELVAGVPHWLRLRSPERDTVLYPEVSYPTYAMGATLAGCRAVPVPADDQHRIDLSQIDQADADRALCLWVNTPGNPAGGLDDLDAAAAWGRAHDVPVLSDECYAEFTWAGEPRTILSAGLDGVLAVHSVSKRSNLAGARIGFYAGDGDLVHYLREVRKHAGFMPPGPSQAAAASALGDDGHVETQRARYLERLERMRAILAAAGIEVGLPDGGFYLWVPVPDGDEWGFVEWLAKEGGALGSPGDFYREGGAGHVRLALVQPLDQLELVAGRLGVA